MAGALLRMEDDMTELAVTVIECLSSRRAGRVSCDFRAWKV